jgi:hypothetical protein
MKKISLCLFMLLFSASLSAQKIALKNNLLYDAGFRAPNLAVEFGLAPRMTLDLLGSYSGYNLGKATSAAGVKFDKKFRHWLVQPELRFWSCERFNGFFWGIHLHGGELNAAGIKLPFKLYPGLRNYRYQGSFYGGGVSLGKQWIIGKRWNLEASVGAGYVHFKYDQFECGDCGAKIKSGKRNYIGPTKATLSLVYILK